MATPPTNAGKKFAPEPLTRAEIDRLLSAASTRSNSGLRQRALIGVMYGAGLRLAEALALMPRDVDVQAGNVRVRNGKGGKPATVGIYPRGVSLLDRWLHQRHSLGLTGRHPIFATYEAGKVGGPLTPRYVRATLERLGVRAGIEKRVHPHGLRHSLAFDMAQGGIPMHQIQAQLRHASLGITDRYVRHLLPADVISVMRASDW